MSSMNYPPDKLFQYEFVGSLFFLPSSSESSAICQLEFAGWGPDMVARISLRDKNYDIQNELLLCPDGDRRFFSRRNIAPYDSGTEVQLVIVKDRLTRIFHAPLISGRSAAQMCAGLLQRPRLRLQPGLVSPTAGLLRVAAPTPAWVAGHFCVLAPARRYLPVKVSATGSWREQRSARSASWRPGTGGCAGYCASPRRRP